MKQVKGVQECNEKEVLNQVIVRLRSRYASENSFFILRYSMFYIMEKLSGKVFCSNVVSKISFVYVLLFINIKLLFLLQTYVSARSLYFKSDFLKGKNLSLRMKIINRLKVQFQTKQNKYFNKEGEVIGHCLNFLVRFVQLLLQRIICYHCQ